MVRADQSATVATGGSVIFSVTANGTAPFGYQWKKAGANIAGATAGTYQILNAQTANAGNYTVLVSNSAGSTTSDQGILTVSASAIAPGITTQPLSRAVTAGSTVAFSVVVTGSPTPALQWRFNGANLAGATGTTLNLANVQAANAGSYTVVATNSAGTITSAAAVLTVSAGAVAPAITTQPLSRAVTAGSTVAFSVVVTGSPTPTLQWRFNGTNLAGATGATLNLANVQTANAGSYTVVATNSAGTITSAAAVLTISIAVPRVTGDFNGDGRADILWENLLTGERLLWLQNGATVLSSVSLGVVAPAWTKVGIGDFNGDGKTDILWENTALNVRGFWLMNGTSFGSWVQLVSVVPGWRAIGTGDFNGDGKPDILWENTALGARGLWLMNGTNFSSWVQLSP